MLRPGNFIPTGIVRLGRYSYMIIMQFTVRVEVKKDAPDAPPRISPWRPDKNRDFWREVTSSDTSTSDTDGKYRVK